MKKSAKVSAAVLALFISFSAAFADSAQQDILSGNTARQENLKTSRKKAKEKKNKTSQKKISSNEEPFAAKTVKTVSGNIKLLLKGSIGSFQIYTLNKDKAYIPVLAGYDEFTSSFLSLKAGKKEYKLTNNTGIVIGARKNKEGAQMIYIVPETASININFNFISSEYSKPADVLKITVSVLNKKKYTETFAIKNILDTVLGEYKGPHFSTAEEIAINNERQFRRFDKIRWIYSGNEKAGMQILLYGADITPLEAVSLCNKDLFLLQSWIPAAVHARSFDSVVSYNNSAAALNWNEVLLNPFEEASFTYYIIFSNNGKIPEGERFISSLLKKSPVKSDDIPEKKEIIKAEKPKKEKQPASSKEIEEKIVDELEPVKEEAIPNEPVIFEEEPKKEEPAAVKKEIEEKIIDDHEIFEEEAEPIEPKIFEKEPLKEQIAEKIPEKKTLRQNKTSKRYFKRRIQFNPDVVENYRIYEDYIEELIEKINILESDPNNIDRSELLQLNSELDSILKKLRRTK